MDDLSDRIARLPAWAREHIKHIKHISKCQEPLLEEAVRARYRANAAEARARRLLESNNALLELLRRAGEGGHDWAKLVVSILEGYEIYRSGEGQ